MKFLYENFFAILFTCTYKYNSANSKQLLTNPLATPKIIGALMVLVQDVFNWDYLENYPKNKNKITEYKENIKCHLSLVTCHLALFTRPLI